MYLLLWLLLAAPLGFAVFVSVNRQTKRITDAKCKLLEAELNDQLTSNAVDAYTIEELAELKRAELNLETEKTRLEAKRAQILHDQQVADDLKVLAAHTEAQITLAREGRPVDIVGEYERFLNARRPHQFRTTPTFEQFVAIHNKAR